MHFVELEKIKVGELVAVPVKDYEDRLLINSGRILTPRILSRLETMGITGIYVADEFNIDYTPDETITEGLKTSTIKNLKKLNIDNALMNAKGIVSSLVDNPQCDYINIKTFDNYTYEHSISVAVYAVLVGIEAGLAHKELVNLAYSGLLHDIGKICIADNILNKPGKLTYNEYEEMKRHPEYGYNMLKDNYDISATTKVGIFEHHENEDGSGYPRQLTGKNIYKFAKIIHIVDVYDAIISKRPYKPAKSPRKAIEYLKDNRNTMFDSNYLDMFVNIVPAYPRGVMVTLSNGMIGIVVKNERGKVLRPTIQTIDGTVIDLANDETYKNIEIV